MYYQNLYNKQHIDSSFQSYLRSSEPINERKKQTPNSFFEEDIQKIKNVKKNTQQNESINNTNDETPIEKLQQKYKIKNETTVNSKLDVFNGQKLRKEARNKSLSNSYLNLSLEPKFISPTNKKKIEFYYGNNPLEVLNEETFQKESKMRINQNKTNRVKDYLGSNGMKSSLRSNLNSNCNDGKITTTPIQLVNTPTYKNKMFNKKKQVIAHDSHSNSSFYII